MAQSNGSKEINERLESALSYLATRYTAAYATYETAKDNLCKHPENSLIYVVNDPTMGSNGLWAVVGGKLVKAPWDALSSALTSEPFEVLQSIFQGAAGEKIEYEGKTYDTLATLTQTLAEGKNYIQDVLVDLAQSNIFTASYLLTESGKFQEEVNRDVQASLGDIYEQGAALPYKVGTVYKENSVVVKDGRFKQWNGTDWINFGRDDDALKSANNLSDLPNKEASRTNLEVYSKIEVVDAISSAIPEATESVAGKAKVATTAIAQAGVNDTDIITAKKLAETVFGIGQTIQDVTVNREINTTYTNSTSKAIFISITTTMGGIGATGALNIGGVVWCSGVVHSQTPSQVYMCGIIPPYSTYSYTGRPFLKWMEYSQ